MSLLSRRCLEGEADHARFAVALWEYSLLMGLSDE